MTTRTKLAAHHSQLKAHSSKLTTQSSQLIAHHIFEKQATSNSCRKAATPATSNQLLRSRQLLILIPILILILTYLNDYKNEVHNSGSLPF